MRDEPNLAILSQVLARCEEFQIAQQECGNSETKREHDPLILLSAAGIAVGGGGAFITLISATTPMALAIGGLFGCVCFASLGAADMRDRKLGKAVKAAREHVADIKNAMLVDYRHLLKAAADAVCMPPRMLAANVQPVGPERAWSTHIKVVPK